MTVWKQLRVDLKSQIPLVTQLAQQIRLLLAAGSLKPYDKLPAIRQLGGQLGISFHTVRAAYQQLEAEGLVATRQGMGTQIIATKPTLPRRRNDQFQNFTIGVLLPAFADFYAPMLSGIQEAASEGPSLFLLCDCREDPKLAASYFDQLLARGVEGIICLSIPFATLAGAKEIRRHPKNYPPLVFVDIPKFPPPLLTFDLEDGAFLAAKHIIEHGHKKIGLIIPSVNWANNKEKLKGYKRAFEQAGISLPVQQIIEVADYGIDSGYRATKMLMGTIKGLSAIISAGDLLAAGATRALREARLNVPEDIALIGFDNTTVSTLVEPNLTTVNLPAFEMGQQAYRMLKDVMNGELRQLEKVLPANLVIRQSCGCL